LARQRVDPLPKLLYFRLAISSAQSASARLQSRSGRRRCAVIVLSIVVSARQPPPHDDDFGNVTARLVLSQFCHVLRAGGQAACGVELAEQFHVDLFVDDVSQLVLGLVVRLVDCDHRLADVDDGHVLLDRHHHEEVVVAASRDHHVRQPVPRKLIPCDGEIVDGDDDVQRAVRTGDLRHLLGKIQRKILVPPDVPATSDHHRSVENVQLLKRNKCADNLHETFTQA